MEDWNAMWDFSRLKARVRCLRGWEIRVWLGFYGSDSDLGGFLMVNATRIWDRKYEFDGVWNAQRERAQVWILDGGARLEIKKYWPLKQIIVLHVQGNLQELRYSFCQHKSDNATCYSQCHINNIYRVAPKIAMTHFIHYNKFGYF